MTGTAGRRAACGSCWSSPTLPGTSRTGYAAAWVAALEDEGAVVERLAALPASWAAHGPQQTDLVIGHVLVEEVAAFAPTLQAVVGARVRRRAGC